MALARSRKRSPTKLLDDSEGTMYKFRILLPDGAVVDLDLHDPGAEMSVNEFVVAVRSEFERSAKRSPSAKRTILWDGNICLYDVSKEKKIKKIIFSNFRSNKRHTLKLHDGAKETASTFQNMWDLTPDTDLLSELPAEYTFETALADLIDNSLQAVWSNVQGERRLVRVMIDERKISIFDTGPGMDGSDEKSIVKWGKMGSSSNRASKKLAVGGKPPYLMPSFGMFGYGGTMASMHLGRWALVSSKTKESRRVYTLNLEREALLKSSGSECTWRTDGSIRDPLEHEIQLSPHGSFTMVEIHEPKFPKSLETSQLQYRLKDIYFPYIQCDDEHIAYNSGRTTMPIEFQVNDIDLAEIEGGEVAVTNLHSCHGPHFVLQLHFIKKDTTTSAGSRTSSVANACLKCVYFPIVEGKESIDLILEKLQADGCGISETFENFCRVSIRRLGRLLPDARWERLPFMEPKQKRGDKAHLLKRCYSRVKCFVETDAGFSPTPSKTDLAHHDSFTTALRKFGDTCFVRDSERTVEIRMGEKLVNYPELEKKYQDWVFQMHKRYDEEIDSGEDQPVIVVMPHNKKGLGITSDVVRVHQAIKRKGASWISGQKIRILKGAVGCHQKNLYATLEYILLEGFQGDSGGEARLICRPMGCSDDRGCFLEVNGNITNLDIRGSSSFPISVIDSGKCEAIDTAAWEHELEKQHQKALSAIYTLNVQQCRQLEIDGAIPIDSPISAGTVSLKEIVAVIRPANFSTSCSADSLDQKYIIKKNDIEMSMEIRCVSGGKDCQECLVVHKDRVKPSSRKGLGGLYIFPLGYKSSTLFHHAGVYRFCFSICENSSCKELQVQVLVEPSSRFCKWGVLYGAKGPFTNRKPFKVRVGTLIPHLSIACYDEFSNPRPFKSIPKVNIRINRDGRTLGHVDKMMTNITSGKMTLEITDMFIESSRLDLIRPHYEANLEISSQDELLSAIVPCVVIPGNLDRVEIKKFSELGNSLLPGDFVKDFILELFDAYGNHVAKGLEVRIEVHGFSFQDQTSPTLKVDNEGYINLSGLIRVTAGYGSSVSLSVYSEEKLFFKQEFQVAKRELRVGSGVPGHCIPGSKLENIIFEVIDSEGSVDERIHDDDVHGQSHTLKITSQSSKIEDTIRYTFRYGRCIVPVISVPQEHGTFCFMASHSHNPELFTSVKVSILQPTKSDDKIVHVPDAFSQSANCMGAIVESFCDDEKRLEQALGEVGGQIAKYENQLKMLHDQKTEIGQEILHLQASLDPKCLTQLDYLMDAKEEIMKRIEGKDDKAAAVFCNLLKTTHFKKSDRHIMQDVVGIVALVGSVDNSRLSRMFAEYLGEDYMLAVVVKSYESARALENCIKNGKVNCDRALDEAAATLQKMISGRFLVICLEVIRPYRGCFEGYDPHKKLLLPDPLLPSGRIPPGFLGYAVNMINVDTQHLHTRTSAGHGLRETLFYCLFDELQVYETRKDMQRASPCIKFGAVSLDGGIMKGNGVISLGDCQAEIIFPVGPQVQNHLTKHTVDVIHKIHDDKIKQKALSEKIAEISRGHAKAIRKFQKKKDKLSRWMVDKEPIIKGLLEYNTNVTNN